MNKDVQNFLSRNNANLEEINNIDCHIYTPDEINIVTSRYGFHKKPIFENISIADVVGYDNYDEETDIFSSMKNYFDSTLPGYRSRSMGMLNYSSYQIIESLKDSFTNEPIVLAENEKDKYTVSTNGFHRFTVLRAHYLIEKSRIKDNPEALEKLKQKYMIPVKVEKIDYLKTYAKFLLKQATSDYEIYKDLDQDYNYTGKVVVRTKTGDESVLNDNELIDFTKAVLESSQDLNINLITQFGKKYPTLGNFLETYDILSVLDKGGFVNDNIR